MSPRAKALSQLCGAAAAGIILIGGLSYAINSSQKINEYLISRNPAMYISGVADYLEANPVESGKYQAGLSELVRGVNSVPGLLEEDRLYLFETNASLVDAGKAAGICESQVVSRLDEEAKLEYALYSIDRTENKYYLRIVGEMLKNVGEDAYNSISEMFRK